MPHCRCADMLLELAEDLDSNAAVIMSQPCEPIANHVAKRIRAVVKQHEINRLEDSSPLASEHLQAL